MRSVVGALIWASMNALGAEARDRTYYVQAEEITWDYAPTDWNLVGCKPLEYDAAATPFISVCSVRMALQRLFARRLATRSCLCWLWLILCHLQGGGGYIGRVYKKAMYYEYTDDTFTTRISRDDSMGFLGPALRAEACTLPVFSATDCVDVCRGCHPRYLETDRTYMNATKRVYRYALHQADASTDNSADVCAGWGHDEGCVQERGDHAILDAPARRLLRQGSGRCRLRRYRAQWCVGGHAA